MPIKLQQLDRVISIDCNQQHIGDLRSHTVTRTETSTIDTK